MNSSKCGAQNTEPPGTAAGYNPAWLGWAALLVPVLAANLAYLISANDGLVPWCFAYLEGCTSISRAARVGDATPVFRALMLPYTGLLAAVWWLNAHWLRGLLPERRKRRTTMLTLGVLAAVFLALYVSYLGVEGDTARWLRRYGINVYFGFSVLAQMLLTSLLHGVSAVPLLTRRAMTALCCALLGLGLASLPLQALVVDRDALLNAIEWSYALLMSLFFPFVVYAWNATGFRIGVQVWNSGAARHSKPHTPETPP